MSIKSAVSKAKSAVSKAVSTVKSAVSSAAKAVSSAASKAVSTVKSAASSVSSSSNKSSSSPSSSGGGSSSAASSGSSSSKSSSSSGSSSSKSSSSSGGSSSSSKSSGSSSPAPATTTGTGQVLDSSGNAIASTWNPPMVVAGSTSGNKVGSNISDLQTKQIQQLVGVSADGVYGADTTAAVKKYQTSKGLIADGIVGPQTAAAMKTDLGISGNTNTNTTNTTNTSSNMTSQEIKSLQSFLMSMDYDVGASGADGILGANTQNAIKQFQQDNGLSADGVIGPQTIDKINEVIEKNNIDITEDPYQTETKTGYEAPSISNHWGLTQKEWNSIPPMLQEMFNSMNGVINGMTAQGYVINPNLSIDETTAKKFLEQAKNKVAPVFKEQINNILADLNRSTESILKEREQSLLNREADYFKSLGINRENFAGSGLAFSGQRNLNEQTTKDTENRNLGYADLLYGNKIADLSREAEKSVGASNMYGYKLPTMTSKLANLGLSPKSTYSTGGTFTPNYAPGSYQYGSIPTEQERAISDLGQTYITQANKLLSQGRSYNDLLI